MGVEVRLLDTFPHVDSLGPEEIIALGGFGTISTSDFNEMKERLGREEIEEKVRDILLNAIVRGYASMTTSTAVLFSIKGSRILDLFVTAYPYGSYMVLSQRYVPVDKPEMPGWVGNDVRNFVKEEIRVYKEIVDLGVKREEARGVLGLGTPTHMLAVFSVESISGLRKWGGEHREIGEFLDLLEDEVLRSDVAEIYLTTRNAPTMGGPFPHPFHREALEAGDWEVVSYSWNGRTDGVEETKRAIKEIRRNPPRTWKDLVENTIKLSKIAYLHSTEFSVTLRGKMPLTTFNELKRHRTLKIAVEGIYNAMERGEFYVYPSVKNHEEAKRLYDWVISEFSRLDAPEEEKVYALPQSVLLGVEFILEFHQLTAPSLFYRIRSCDRAETSMKQIVRRIPYLIRDAVPEYGEKLFGVLTAELNGSRVPLPKCVIGGCPEPNFCPLVKGMNPDYDEEIHKRIKKGRKEVVS